MVNAALSGRSVAAVATRLKGLTVRFFALESLDCLAGIAQLVEHNLAKVGVASSSLVSRSKFSSLDFSGLFFLQGNLEPAFG